MSSQIAINLPLVYIGMGILSYNLVAPVFDTFSGYMPPGLFKYITYGVLWPIPISAVICCLIHEKFDYIYRKYIYDIFEEWPQPNANM
jgi:hypothetical protein